MLTVYTILVLGAILMQAFFTASEMAITSVNRIKLKQLLEAGDHHARKLSRFLEKEGMYLGTTLVGTNLAVVISSVLATRIFAEYFRPNVTPLLTTLVMVPVTLVFAEIVPKMISRHYSTSFALRAVDPLSGFNKAFKPIILAVNTVANILLMPFGKRKTPWDLTFTKSDLKRILQHGHETGGVEADEVELIHKVLDFGAKKVKDTMIPLFRVSSISADDSVDNLKSLIALTGFSRVPVYRGNKNNILGIVNIYDILFEERNGQGNPSLEQYIRPPVNVAPGDGLDIALTRLRNQEQPMGIVVDKDNSVMGIITLEDILEEIVGEIEDTGEGA